MMFEKHYIKNKFRTDCYFSLASRFFEFAGRRFEIVATEITGRGPLDATSDIKDMATGEIERKVTWSKLKEMNLTPVRE